RGCRRPPARGPRPPVPPSRTAAHPELGSSPQPSRLLGRGWSSRTVRIGDAARYNACREPFAPFLGSGLLARFEVILQIDEEALGLATTSNPCFRSFRLIAVDALPLRTAGPLKRVSKAATFVWPWPSDVSQSRTPGPWASRSSTRSLLGFCAVATAHLRVRK